MAVQSSGKAQGRRASDVKMLRDSGNTTAQLSNKHLHQKTTFPAS
jgi:hypothetical protein